MTEEPTLDEREVMTWADLGEGSRELAEQVHRDGYRPDIVLAIARGGLLVAGGLSYSLGVKNTFTMNVEFYTGIDERLPVPMILPPVPDLVDFGETRVLIADDVADTGATLALVKDFCEGKVGEVVRPCSTRSRARPSAASTSIFAFWRPVLCLVGAHLFGAFQALPFTFQAKSLLTHVPPEFFQALPYVMTIVVLVAVSFARAKRRLGAPGALGVPYVREER